MNKDLPIGWVKTKLGEIGSWGSGGTPKATNDKYYNGSIPWAKIGDLNDGLVVKTEDYITEEGLINSSAKIVEEGTLLVAMYGSIGKLGIAGVKLSTNQAIAFCKVNEKLVAKEFVFYYLRSRREHLLSMGQGGTQQNISQTILKVYPILLPPINEQRRIVEKLDRIFDRLRKVRDELSHIKKLIDRYRQSVLTAAFRGDLTANWRENKVSYDLSLGSFNCEIDEKGWLNLKAEDVCSVQCGSTPKGKPFTDKGDIPYLKVYNIVDQKINFDYRPQFIPYEVHQGELKRCITLPGDILINIVGPPLGKVAIVTNQFNEWNINQALVLFRPRKMITKEYLYYFLREGQFFRTIENKTKGTVGQINISLTQCRNCVIPIPPFEEQKEIVRRIEERFAKIEKIEQEYQKAVKLCDRLEQETLAKAFRGELVPQDPNDEPASILLERIRAEQQPKNQAKTAKSKKRSGKK